MTEQKVINLEEQTEEWIKAAMYDQICILENVNKNLNALRGELDRREKVRQQNLIKGGNQCQSETKTSES